MRLGRDTRGRSTQDSSSAGARADSRSRDWNSTRAGWARVICSSRFPAARPTAGSSPRTRWRAALSPLPAKRRPRRISPRRWIQVEHGRQALALAARNFYGRPDERLVLTGITGTNGKTTTSYLVDSVLRAAGQTTAHDRHHRVSPGGARAAGGQHHAGIARSASACSRSWSGAGRDARDHGGLLARAGAGPRVRPAVSHCASSPI